MAKMAEVAKLAITAGMPALKFKECALQAMIHEAMRLSDWNQCKAAMLLGMHRNTLGRYLRRKHEPGR